MSNENAPVQHTTKATRRDFLQGALAVTGALAANGIAPPPAAAQPKQKRPNIVYFLGEGQRADCLSIAGHPILKTPNHDRIGARGHALQQCLLHQRPLRPRARRRAHRHVLPFHRRALQRSTSTSRCPPTFRSSLTFSRRPATRSPSSAKSTCPTASKTATGTTTSATTIPRNNYANPFFKEGRNGNVGPEQRYHNVYPDDLTTDRALAWLDQDRGDKPFCLLVWFVAPHEPFFRPRRHLDLYNGVTIPKPDTFDDDLKGYPGKPKGFIDAENKIGTTPSHPACGSLEGIDEGLLRRPRRRRREHRPRLHAISKKKNILDDTAILHTSDHGYFLGEWRMFDKRLMHEPSIRVPLMLRYPKRVPAGTVRDEMILDIDIAPTLLDLAGVPIPAHMQGKSMLPLANSSRPRLPQGVVLRVLRVAQPGERRTPPRHSHRALQTHPLRHGLSPKGSSSTTSKPTPPRRNNLYNKPEHVQTPDPPHRTPGSPTDQLSRTPKDLTTTEAVILSKAQRAKSKDLHFARSAQKS